MENGTVVLGFDVGGTKIGIGLADAGGKILGKARIENVNTDPADILPLMAAEAKRIVSEAGLNMGKIAGFGISAPYPADADKGIMIAPPNNPKWRNVPLLSFLEKELGIKGCFENDANCGALAEWFFGAGRGCTDFIYLTMSTGIGGGIIASNHLVRGAKSRSAGEMGHICLELGGRKCNCGMTGCYEAYCGGRALALRMQSELRDKPDSMIMRLVEGDASKIDMVVLEKAFRAGDDYAVKLWDEMSLRNAQAFGMYINTFNPQKLVLGTLAWAIGDIYTDPIKKYLPRFAWRQLIDDCGIVPSELRREIGSYAGAAAALNMLRERK